MKFAIALAAVLMLATLAACSEEPSGPPDSVDPCLQAPCLHEGTCRPQGNAYTCACAAGWTGPTCETALPPFATSCTGRPSLSYSPSLLAQLHTAAADSSYNPVGEARSETFARYRAYAETQTMPSLPHSAPTSIKDMRDASISYYGGVHWAGFLYHVYGDVRHVGAARAAVLAATTWSTWHEPETNNLALADLLDATVLALDWFCDSFSESEREAAMRAAHDLGVSLYRQCEATDSCWVFQPEGPPNHKAIAARSWAHFALALPDHPDSADWLARASVLATEGLARAAGPQGGPMESATYTGDTLLFLAELNVNLADRGVMSLFGDSQWLGKFPAYLGITLGPGNLSVNFSDARLSVFSTVALPAAIMGAQHAGNTPSGQLSQGLAAHLVQLHGGHLPEHIGPKILYYLDSSVTASSPEAWPSSRVYEAVGQVVTRSGWGSDDALFAFRAQPASPHGVVSHRHADAGSFVIHWGGDILAADPGYAAQDFAATSVIDEALVNIGCATDVSAVTEEQRDSVRAFTLLSPGHNTLNMTALNGDPIIQRISPDDIHFLRHQAADDKAFASAEFGATYANPYQAQATKPLQTVQRDVLAYLPHGILIHDYIATPATGEAVIAAFHLQPRNVDVSGLGSGRGTATFNLFETPGVVLKPSDSSRQLRVISSSSQVLTTSVASVPGLSCLPYLKIANEQPAKVVEMFTLLLLETSSDATPTLVPIDDSTRTGIEITRGTTVFTLELAKFGESIDIGGGSRALGRIVETDGSVWVVPE